MGCVVCNLLGESTGEDRAAAQDELSVDLVHGHPDMVRRIGKLALLASRVPTSKVPTKEGYYWYQQPHTPQEEGNWSIVHVFRQEAGEGLRVKWCPTFVTLTWEPIEDLHGVWGERVICEGSERACRLVRRPTIRSEAVSRPGRRQREGDGDGH